MRRQLLRLYLAWRHFTMPGYGGALNALWALACGRFYVFREVRWRIVRDLASMPLDDASEELQRAILAAREERQLRLMRRQFDPR